MLHVDESEVVCKMGDLSQRRGREGKASVLPCISTKWGLIFVKASDLTGHLRNCTSFSLVLHKFSDKELEELRFPKNGQQAQQKLSL